jgi:hypothetical protein
MIGAQGGCKRCENAMKDLKLNGTKASGKTAGLHHQYAGTYAVLAKSQVEQHNKAGAYVKPQVKKEDKLKPQHTMTKPQLLQVIKELKQEKEDQEDQLFSFVNEAMCVFRGRCVCLRFVLPLCVLLGIILLLFNLFR